MTDLVRRFATSPERTAILEGLLDYRAALQAVGIVNGCQWLDGSFVEDVEKSRGRPPMDIDLVTFAYRPNIDNAAWLTLLNERDDLFDFNESKRKYKCDTYYVDLNIYPHLILSSISYFHGLFSHQRVTSLWKGMITVPLGSDDAMARLLL
jgi:hypothetical protein